MTTAAPAITAPAITALPALLAYPEREWPREGVLDRAWAATAAALRARATEGRAARLRPILAACESHAAAMAALPDAALRIQAREAGAALRAGRADDIAGMGRVLAAVAEASHRTLGQRPFPPQLLAAYGCTRGMLVEMATGEGKTLAASLAATALALTGTPVHVLTVNRYLAERDAAFAKPLYGFFGLACGLITDEVPPAARRAAYRCPITVAVNKDVAFDFMRDRMAFGRAIGEPRRKAASLRGGTGAGPLLRGLWHAIVDEADSVLIDEARTPLILSAQADDRPRDPTPFDRALAICATMRADRDYVLREGERRVSLLPEGRRAVGEQVRGETEAPWDVAAERVRLVEQGLTALHLLARDEHYLIRDGRAQIIDEYTGRVLPDRTWNDGLQELVERKEGLALSAPRETQARMTFQRFARRYRRLSGLSGTLHEVAGELWRVYGVRVARVPTHRADRKSILPTRGWRDEDEKWRAIVGRVADLNARGVPTLIGTRTLAASAAASRALGDAGLPHAVLNAAQDAEEAEIVSRAGTPGTITVATNMAGRGTDIHVGDAVARDGGLRVIVSEPHEARRIDRQLIGRCGRQGQPGEAEMHVALDDALLRRHCTAAERMLARALLRPTAGRAASWVAVRAQRRGERLHAAMRRDLMRADALLEDAIAFAGDPE